MLRHTFKEIVIDDIKYFSLSEGLLPLEELETLEFITIRQYGFNDLFNSAIYAITEETLKEFLANENEQ